MARWLVRLEGDHVDLEEFPHWFPEGDVYAFEENSQVFLAGQAFESHDDAAQVQEMALQVVDEFSAVVSLLWPSHRRPEVAAVIRETDEGKRNQHVFLSAVLSARSKVRATLVVEGEAAEGPSETQGQKLLSGALANAHLRVALALWGDPLRTWPRLYRVLEEVERYLGQPVSRAGCCTAKQRERFTRSANSAEVAGKDSRHAAGKFAVPKDPMTLGEATGVVSNLLQQALRQAAAERNEGV